MGIVHPSDLISDSISAVVFESSITSRPLAPTTPFAHCATLPTRVWSTITLALPACPPPLIYNTS